MRRPPPRGFTFLETLFAVLILGIGLLALAALLFAGLSQTEAAVDQTFAASLAQNAFATLRATPELCSAMVADGTYHRFGPSSGPVPLRDQDEALYTALAGEMIDVANPRYAWVGFYRRDSARPGSGAEVVVIVVRSRTKPRYDRADLACAGLGDRARGPLMGRCVEATFWDDGVVLAPDPASGSVDDLRVAAPGAYLLVAIREGRRSDGCRFRLGRLLEDARPDYVRFEATPCSDAAAACERARSAGSVPAWIVGRQADGDRAGREGDAQDVAAFATVMPAP